VVMLDEGNIIYDGALKSLKEKWGEGKELQFQFLEKVNVHSLEALASGMPVKWEMDEKKQIFSALVDDNDELISQVIAKVVAAYKIKDINILEISTEEIIRNIYEKGSV
ncbi:MAG: daunorubicin ABC transporter ATP-binding protein, partial [Bacillota bacterium]|nr:daunorubicin ABC transporter ATP-binding protein [Bacillota bacterium]